ncbi:MAG: carboxymuconolactone decarboxylase family protein [Planctomycetaceae bacterium]
MSRFPQINPESATGRAKELLDAVKSKLGMIPNISRAMANAPAVLEGYLAFSSALGKGTLSAKNREQIALVVGQANGCEYCLAAHSAVGKMVGLTAEQILDSRRGTSVDPKSDAVVRFARKLVDKRGLLTDDELQEARSAGLDDAALAEVIANVALNIFTNYFNHVAETDVDFPAVEPIIDHPQACASIPGCDEAR